MDSAVVPESPAPGSQSRGRIFFVALALLVIVLGAVGYASRDALGRFISVRTLPPELRNGIFIAGPTGTAYESNGFDYVIPPEGNGVMFGDIHTGVRALILRTPDGLFQAVVNGVAIDSSRSLKRDISIAPDGAHIAFAENPDPTDILDANEWTVVVEEIATKKRTVIGSGFSPVFVDATHLMRFSSTGTFVTDLSMGTDMLVFNNAFPEVTPLTQSPDGRMLAWYDTGYIMVYRIKSADPFGIERVAIATSTSQLVSYALGNDALYTLIREEGKSVVHKATAASPDPKTIFTFPPHLLVTSLVL